MWYAHSLEYSMAAKKLRGRKTDKGINVMSTKGVKHKRMPVHDFIYIKLKINK